MKCYFCGEEMKKGETTYTVNRNNYHLLIDDVPAWVCSQCGQVYFEEDEVDSIQELIKNVDAGSAKVRGSTPKPTAV